MTIFELPKVRSLVTRKKSCPEVYSHQWRLNFAKAIGSLMKTPGSKGKVRLRKKLPKVLPSQGTMLANNE